MKLLNTVMDRFVNGKRPPVREEKDLFEKFNELLTDGILLDKDLKGEIITVTFAPNESKIIPHGLRSIPQYRLILKQTGNSVITDVNDKWTDKTVGLLNNSANTVTLTFKLFP